LTPYEYTGIEVYTVNTYDERRPFTLVTTAVHLAYGLMAHDT
jgi:hypothetical protein